VRRPRRGGAEGFSLSFLDCICCGFGGIILLLVLTKIGEPAALERARVDLDALVARLEAELAEIRGETTVLERALSTRSEQRSEELVRVARLQSDLSRIQGEFKSGKQDSEVSEILEGRLVAARQTLTEEMKRLQAQQRTPRTAEQTVGGIPVDSEYVIFIIDISGSMTNYTWSLVVSKMSQVLDIYPKVKGIQVMNDMGHYMFSSYAGKWIPDTPARRKAILDRLRTWRGLSNSSPVEGITRAIQSFAADDKKVSIYVFGDELRPEESIDEVVRTVDRINTKDASGRRRVRIHGIGFPTTFQIGLEATGIRFAILMRILCEQNDGTFVALNEIRR